MSHTIIEYINQHKFLSIYIKLFIVLIEFVKFSNSFFQYLLSTQNQKK